MIVNSVNYKFNACGDKYVLAENLFREACNFVYDQYKGLDIRDFLTYSLKIEREVVRHLSSLGKFPDDDPFLSLSLTKGDQEDSILICPNIHLERWLLNNDFVLETFEKGAVFNDNKHYPHSCPSCSSPAYQCPIFGKVDCSNSCGV